MHIQLREVPATQLKLTKNLNGQNQLECCKTQNFDKTPHKTTKKLINDSLTKYNKETYQ